MNRIVAVPYVYPLEVVKARKRNPERAMVASVVDVVIEDLAGADLVMTAPYVRDRNSSWTIPDCPVVKVVHRDGSFWRQATEGPGHPRLGRTIGFDEFAASGNAGDARLVRPEGTNGYGGAALPLEEIMAQTRRVVSDGRSEAEASIRDRATDVAFMDGDVYVRCLEPVLEEVNIHPAHFLVATMGGENAGDRSKRHLRRADKADDLVDTYRKLDLDDLVEGGFLSTAPVVFRPDLLSFDEDAHLIGIHGRRILEWVTNPRIRQDGIAAGRAADLIRAALPMLEGDETSIVRGASDIAAAALLCVDGAHHDADFCRSVDATFRTRFSERLADLKGVSPTSEVRALGFAFEIDVSPAADENALVAALESHPSVGSVTGGGRRLVVVVGGSGEAAAQAVLRSIVDAADASASPGF